MAMAKFKREWVVLRDRDKQPWVSIKAQTLGKLAIHPHASTNSIGGYYVVTHIPTGARIADAYKVNECKDLVRQLTSLPVNWDFTSSLLPDDIRELAWPVVRAFRGSPDVSGKRVNLSSVKQ